MALRGPYHEGELEVQERAGVADMARRIGRGIHAEIPPAAGAFLLEQRFAVLGWSDGEHVWASALTGEPGFLAAASPDSVSVRADLVAGDPLAARELPPADPGLLAIDFATRRRMRVNGVATGERPGSFALWTRQVYANCPKYIQAREVVTGPGRPGAPVTSSSLGPAQAALVARADTFFIATHHGEGGADASHRGGAPGFVRVEPGGGALSWPDYPGNAMFQTLGNIATGSRAGLLFVDFDTGSTLQLTGSARIAWGAERRVELAIDRAIEIPGALPLRWRFVEASPHNPGS